MTVKLCPHTGDRETCPYCQIVDLESEVGFYQTKCHRREDCPVEPLVKELNRLKWLLSEEERAKVNRVLDEAGSGQKR